jgi:4'-phosphopantetheinyl transferase
VKIFWLTKAAERSLAKDEVEEFLAESLGAYLMSEGRLDSLVRAGARPARGHAEPVLCSDTVLAMTGPTFEHGLHGKPRFADLALRDVHFSISHTKGAAVVAFADREIGIDIERTSRFDKGEERLLGIARRFFADDELAYVVGEGQTTPTALRPPLHRGELASRFFEVWTGKEAYMKWTGRGFSEGFRTFSVFDVEPVIETFRGPEDIVCSVCGEGLDCHASLAMTVMECSQ